MNKITEQELSQDIINDLNLNSDKLITKQIGTQSLKTKEKNNIISSINELNKSDNFMKDMNKFLELCDIQIDNPDDIEKVISEIGKKVIGGKGVKKSIVYEFKETSEQNRNYTLRIPNLISVDKVTVDNGNVSKSINGNKLTLNVSGGNVSSSNSGNKTLSKEVTESRTSSSNSFSSSISYNNDGYSGTLQKDGSSYVYSGSYISSDSKNVTVIKSYTLVFKNGVDITPYLSASEYHNIQYNENEYVGTLSRNLNESDISDAIDYINQLEKDKYTGTQNIRIPYQGIVTRQSSDNRQWKQNYKGIVYKSISTTNTITKEVTDIKTSSSNSFNESLLYNNDGYSGTLQKDGSSYVSSGSYLSGSSRTETDSRTSSSNSFPDSLPYNNGGYLGTLYKDESSYVSSGSYVLEDVKEITKTIRFDYFANRGDPATIKYDEDGYSGLLYFVKEPGDVYVRKDDHYSHSRIEIQYKGNVTKPGYDTRQYTQKYKGTVYKSGYDTRQYTQKYKGIVSKQTSESVNNYKYKVVIYYIAIE